MSFKEMRPGLSQDALNDFARHVGQPEVAAAMSECQFGVVKAKAMQNRGVEVMHVDSVFSDFVSVVVGLAVDDAPFDTAAGQP